MLNLQATLIKTFFLRTAHSTCNFHREQFSLSHVEDEEVGHGSSHADEPDAADDHLRAQLGVAASQRPDDTPVPVHGDDHQRNDAGVDAQMLQSKT